MGRQLLFGFAGLLRLLDGLTPPAFAPRALLGAPDPLKGRQGAGVSLDDRATCGTLV